MSVLREEVCTATASAHFDLQSQSVSNSYPRAITARGIPARFIVREHDRGYSLSATRLSAINSIALCTGNAAIQRWFEIGCHTYRHPWISATTTVFMVA